MLQLTKYYRPGISTCDSGVVLKLWGLPDFTKKQFQHGVALITSIEYDCCSVTVDNLLRPLNKYVLLRDLCCYCLC